MNCYVDVGIACAELLLVTCSEKGNPQENNNLLPSVQLL
jgi:hypothetical protein